MKFNTPLSIAIFFALGISSITGVFSYLMIYVEHEIFLKYLIFELIAVLIISFVIIYFVLKNLLVKKIKPIYNIINASKDDEGKDKKEKNLVSEVEENVASWAGNKDKEIFNLKKMEKFRKEFLGNVSHELKTPIFNIQGYVSTLLDGGLEDETINRKYLERSEKSINRLISIVQDLETISHLESGQLELQLESFNIFELIREVFELQEFKARQKRIKLQVSGTEKNIMVLADRKQILQVLVNLVVNSINYGKEEGRTIIEVREVEDRVHIEVTDNGIGIPEKSLTRLFERFYRVDKSRSRNEGGTGLGLAIVKHVLEAHGQQISVRSREGEGSTFGFTLQRSKK